SCSRRTNLGRCRKFAPIQCRAAFTLSCAVATQPDRTPVDPNSLLAALLLGIIEGITEFLPISSTGHLLVAERWLGHRSDLFNIAIQAGAILAVVLIYRQRLAGLAMSFLKPGEAAVFGQAPRDYAWKLVVAFAVTSVLGIAVKALGWELDNA